MKYINSIKVILLLTLLSVGGQVYGQGISFYLTSLDRALDIAKRENKNVFIDAYADWCVPCKRMDRVFAKSEVGQIFRDHYVSVKVDMDGQYAEEFRNKYQIVFLPTLIIVNPEGDVIYKIDNEISSDKLIDIAVKALQPGGVIEPTPAVASAPSPPVTKPTTTTTVAPKVIKKQPKKNTPKNVVVADVAAANDDGSKIKYVLGTDEVNTDQLRQEAYFKLQLMDGSYLAAADRYLKTQADWSTPENMRFILDFVNSPNDPTYSHIIAHKTDYYKTCGKDKVDNVLQILAYKYLYKGVPRPTYEQALQLYKDLGFKAPKNNTQKYFIVRSKLENDHVKAYHYAVEYFDEMKAQDQEELETFINYTVEHADAYSNDQLNRVAKIASKTKESTETYLPKIIQLYSLSGKCGKVRKLLKKSKLDAAQASELISPTSNCDI